MTRPALLCLAACPVALALAVPAVAEAHFVLVSPGASLEQDDYGDPQKVSPCGDNGSGVATGEITVLQAGSTVTLTIDETVYHPGHYRVAIAQTPGELPAEPPVTPDNQSDCGSVPIMSPAAMPVLADGVFVHDTPFAESQTIEIALPDDFTCTNCTMQVMQWMHDHGAPCFYYHCAQVTIEGGQATSTSPSSGDDTAGTTDDPTDPTDATATTEGGDESSSGNVTGASASATAAEESSGGSAATVASDTSTVGTEDDDTDGGCGCTTTRTSGAAWLGLLAMGLLRRRRRA